MDERRQGWLTVAFVLPENREVPVSNGLSFLLLSGRALACDDKSGVFTQTPEAARGKGELPRAVRKCAWPMSLGTLTWEKPGETKQCLGLAIYSPFSKVGVSASLVLQSSPLVCSAAGEEESCSHMRVRQDKCILHITVFRPVLNLFIKLHLMCSCDSSIAFRGGDTSCYFLQACQNGEAVELS